MSRATLANVLLSSVKVSSLIVVTDTLLRDVSAAGQSLFNRELAGAISDAVDAAFLDLIVNTGTTSTPRPARRRWMRNTICALRCWR